MASINKLSLRGIRAFSPDDQEQVIEFYFPVTIIVGSNGCGKTTIIEALKYAVTGALPPGKNPGQSFVHDPKSIGQSVVKANVKLRFTNKAGLSMVVVRSMELSQKKSSMTFKALDGILRTTDSTTGERVSLSHKCTELDRAIPQLLGVSKPILEHVVFCHQEDASWPLSEGAVLKKRFDDIFDSTRYAKALKAIQETRKEYTAIVKDLKVDLAALNSHKHAAKGFRSELSEQNEGLEVLEQSLEETNKEMKELEEERRRNEEIASQVEEIRFNIDDRKNDLEKETSVLQTHRNMLQEDLTQTYSARDLKDKLRDFGDTVTKQNDRRHELERDAETAQKAIEDIREEDLQLRRQTGKLQAEKEAHDKLSRRRLEKMEEVAEKYDVQLPVSQTQATQNTNASFTATQTSFFASQSAEIANTQDTVVFVSKEDIQAFLRAVGDKEGTLKENLRNHRQQTLQQTNHIQDQLNELNAKHKSIEHEKQKLENEQNEALGEMQNLASQASSHARIRKTDIEDTKRQAVSFARDRDAANNDKRLKEIPAEIRSYEGQIDKLKRDIEYDHQVLKVLRLNSDAQNAITVLKEQTVSELESLQESLSDNSFIFQKFNLSTPAQLPGADGGDAEGEELVETIDTLAGAVRNKYETVQEELNKAKSDQASKSRTASEKTALLAHNKQSLIRMRDKLEALGGDEGPVGTFQRIVSSMCKFETSLGKTDQVRNPDDPQEILKYLTSRIEELEASSLDVLQPEVVSKVVNHMLQLSIIRNDDGEELKQFCPCCRRDFGSSSDFDIFRESMFELMDVERSELLLSNRQQAERDRSAKSNYQRWRKSIGECMQGVLEFRRIFTEVKDIETIVKDTEEDLAALQTDLVGLNDTCTDLQSDADELRDALDSTKRWTDDAGKLSRKKMEISSKQVDLSISTTDMADRDLETVENDLNRRMVQKDELTDKINKANRDVTELNARITQLSAKATRFEEMAREKQKKYDEEQASNVRKSELGDRIKAIQSESRKLLDQSAQLRRKIRDKEGDLNRLRASTKDEEDRLANIVSKFDYDVSALREMTKQIDAYVESAKSGDLDEIEKKISSLEQRKKSKEANLAEIEPELDQVKRAIADQERHRKLIQENLELLGAEDRIKELKRSISSLEEDMAQVEGSDTCVANLQSCQERLATLVEKKANLNGRRSGYVDQVRTLQRKLQSAEYKDIDERHRVVMIKHETTQIAVSDLEKYHDALDKALLRYHGIKIAEINRIIRELWTLTYKGQDITSIELEAGQEGGSKKSYNYRVVMTKGSTQLDMRGRCSAGQRVLASIVIRLALAETFGVACGVIALDEPTVNLDYNNKRGLAVALAQIIASRAQQANFQLLVITHDEDFVGMMKNELASESGKFPMPEKYFQVRREEGADGKFYSKINAVDWDDLV